MSRLALAFAAGFATLVTAGTAAAADYPDPFGSGTDLRSGFGDSADNSDTNSPLSFEAGVRYWYSMGAQDFSLGAPGSITESDKSHSVEAHFRIDDNSTKTYVKGLAGMSFKIDGDSSAGSGTVSNGSIGYLGGDIGYSWFGNSTGNSFGPFMGYMYWNDSPNTAHGDFTTAASASDISYDPVSGQTFWPGNSTTNNLSTNLLRLGVSGKADLGPMFDVSGEVAAVPYAKLSGIIGSSDGILSYNAQLPTMPVGDLNVHDIQSSPTSIDGWGYGAMVEAMLGFHPTSNMTLRLGGRAWYLQGTADETYSIATIGNPSKSSGATNYDTAPSFNNQNYIARANPWSLFRYGALAEFSYKF